MYRTAHMHHIQQRILNDLSRTSPLRFSELQPKHIPNNVFSYHLKRLIDTGYVASMEGGYVPTRKALKMFPYVDASPARLGRPLNLTMLLVTNNRGEFLLRRHAADPFRGLLSTPSGQIHAGETIDQAAQRELFEKTGILVARDELRSVGVLDFRYMEEGTHDIFIHGIGFVYLYVFDEAHAAIELPDGLVWSAPDAPDVLQEVREAAELAQQEHIVVRSVDFREPNYLIGLS